MSGITLHNQILLSGLLVPVIYVTGAQCIAFHATNFSSL